MNVIVSNKQKNIIDNANIDAIKDLNGLFNIDDLINKFKNYFFSKIILDATSIVNFTSDEVLQKLVDGFGAERLIILLPAVPEPPKEFTDKLNSLKIYNYSNDINEVVQLLNNPRTQNDITSPVEQNDEKSFYIDNSVKEDANFQQSNDSNSDFSLSNAINSMAINNDLSQMSNQMYTDDDNYNNSNFDQQNNAFNNISDNNTEENSNNNSIGSNTLDDNMNNSFSQNTNIDFSNNIVQNINPTNNNLNSNVFLHPNIVNEINNANNIQKKVIGIKNVTLHAGSTTLIYMLYKAISYTLNKSVTAYEIDCDNFKYYQERNMISCSSNDILGLVSNCNSEIILIDLNNFDDLNLCNDVLFLVEPSVIRLNRLMMEKSGVFSTLQNKKIVLNMSLLSENEVNALSSEAKVAMFYNIPPLDDRKDNNILIDLLNKLGIK